MCLSVLARFFMVVNDDFSEPLQDAVVEMMRIQAAPKPHLDIFTVDPFEYPFFRACFVEVVETVVANQRGRLTRLIKFTGGDAKDLIKHLVHADQDDCYDKAIQMLDKGYGNPHLIRANLPTPTFPAVLRKVPTSPTPQRTQTHTSSTHHTHSA